MKTKKIAIIILIVGLILIIIAPILITQSFGFISFINTGGIGDTIGGVTAPISGLIGSILVYLALRAQIDANEIIQKQIADQKIDEKNRKLYIYVSDQIEFVRREINNVLFNSIRKQGEKSEKIDLKGTSAINETLLICSQINQNHFDKNLLIAFPNLTKIRLLLEKCESIIHLIERFDFDSEDKKYLLDSIKFVYEMKLKPYLVLHEDKRMSKSVPCKYCKKKHDGIPEEIYLIFDRINITLPTTTF